MSSVPVPALPTRRLRRRTDRRVLAGVAGGIADRVNAPVGFVRFFLFVACAGGWWVVAAYAVAALAIPADGRDRPDWDNVVGLTRLALPLGVGVLLPTSHLMVDDPFTGSPGWWIAYYGLTFAAGTALIASAYRRTRPYTAADARAAVLAGVPVATVVALLAGAVVLVPDVRWDSFVFLAPLVGVAAAIGRGTSPQTLATAAFALALAAMVVGAGARLEGGVGDLHVAPRADDKRAIIVRRAAGDVEVDLRRIALRGGPVQLDASVGFGDVELTVPAGSPLDLAVHVGEGRISGLLYEPRYFTRQGFDAQLVRSLPSQQHSDPVAPIRVRLDVGMGNVEVHRRQNRSEAAR